MYCSQCGKEIPDNSRFCNECGSPVSKNNDQQVSGGVILQEVSSSKKKNVRKPVKLGRTIIAIVVVVAIALSCVVLPKMFSRYDWSEVKLNSILSEPESKWGNLSSNEEDYLYLEVHRTSLEEYESYVETCEEDGFDIEVEKYESSYTAFNKDGYKLSVDYSESDKEMVICLTAPMDMQKIQWPTSDIASLLPTPESTFGFIDRNNEECFSIYLGNTSYAEYNAYVIECEAKGFTVDFQKQDKYYFAENEDGYQLVVEYKGYNVVYISIDEPKRTLDLSFASVNSEFEFSVYIDDSWELDVEKGKTETCTVDLGMGEHIIKVSSYDDYDVYDNYVITVTKNEKISFDVCCTEDRIEIGLSGEVAVDDPADSDKAEKEDSDNESSAPQESLDSETNSGSADDIDPYDYATAVCQSIKDSLYNPDSIQIHKVYYLDSYWHNFYVDFSAMNQLGGYTRESYEAVFNKDSSLYSFGEVYDLPDIYEEQGCEKLDVDVIEANLE